MSGTRVANAPSNPVASRRIILGSGLAAAVIGLVGARSPARATATAFPTRPVRVIVPFPPAGAADIITRMLSERLAQELGQPVMVENRTGAGGRVGTEAAVRAPADGYIMLMGSQATNSINPELYKDLSYDPAKDLVPVALVGGVGSVLYVRNDLDVRSFPELLARARAQPGTLTYGSAGIGGGSHLAMALLESMAKLELNHIPYRGTAPAAADVLAGRIDMLCDPVPSALPMLSGNRVRPLAVTTPERHPRLPDVPTIAEAGVPGYDAVSYYGFFAPTGVPEDILAKLRSATAKVIAEDALGQRLAEQGVVRLGLSPQKFADYVAADRKRWGTVIREANITVD